MKKELSDVGYYSIISSVEFWEDNQLVRVEDPVFQSEDIEFLNLKPKEKEVSKSQFHLSLLRNIDRIAMITLLAICSMGILGFVGGKIVGITVIGAGSYFMLKNKTSYSEKALGLAVVNSIGFLAIMKFISTPLAGYCILLSAGWGYYQSRANTKV